jgi:hypothetical protein
MRCDYLAVQYLQRTGRFGVEDLIEASGMIDNVERLGIVVIFVSKFLGSTMLIAGFSL